MNKLKLKGQFETLDKKATINLKGGNIFINLSNPPIIISGTPPPIGFSQIFPIT